MFEKESYELVLDRLGPEIYECWDESQGFCPARVNHPRELQLLWAAQNCLIHVCDGGFHHYFEKLPGITAPEAAEGFDLIGLWDCGNVLKRAMAVFGEPYPRPASARRKWLNAFGESHQNSLRSPGSPFAEFEKEFFSRRPEDRFDDAANRLVERFA